jgi:hypothetical protein
MLVKPLHPPSNLRSRSVRSTTPTASSVFRRSSRCATSGLNSPNPRAYRVYSLGLLSSLSLWPDCATPKTEGPSAPARSKHTNQFISLHRSSLSIDQSLSFFAILASFPDFEGRICCHVIFRMTVGPLRPTLCIVVHTLVLDYSLTFRTSSDTPTHSFAHYMYQ